MKDENTSPGREDSATIRSAYDIKADLLRRAFDGQTKRTTAELIRLMCEAHMRSETVPEDHQKVLAEIELGQPRGVLMLNALAAWMGSDVRYHCAGEDGIPYPTILTLQ